MSISETDQRRFRILQIVEVGPLERVASGHALEILRSQHFSVTHELFREDLVWLEERGLVETGPLDAEVWIAITGAGEEVVDLAAPGQTLRSISLGHGAHLTLTGDEPIDDAKQRALAEAARDLVRALLDGPAQGGDISPGPDRHLGAREAQ